MFLLTLDNSDHPMMKSNNGNKVLLIALSSNRGLCGGFNNNVVKEIKKLFLLILKIIILY